MTDYAKFSINLAVSLNSDYSNPYVSADQVPAYTFTPASAQLWKVDVINGTNTVTLAPYTAVTQAIIHNLATNTATLRVNYTDDTTSTANSVTIPIGGYAILPTVKVSANIALVGTAAGSAFVILAGT